MKSVLICGDSYSAAREGDTGLDAGWAAMLLGAQSPFRQGVSGSTALQWNIAETGYLERAVTTQSDVLIISLLGNDAFALEGEVSNPAQLLQDVAKSYGAFESVLARLKRKETYVLLYPDAFNGQNQAYNIGLPMLNGAIKSAVYSVDKSIQCVDLGQILSPSDFNGKDIHPIHSGHLKIAAYFQKLLA